MFVMTQYFFHFVGEGHEYVDADGQSFSDLISARAYAARVARELEQDSSEYLGCSICIVNEQGEELDRVSVGTNVINVG
jgi:hypothetical protein